VFAKELVDLKNKLNGQAADHIESLIKKIEEKTQGSCSSNPKSGFQLAVAICHRLDEQHKDIAKFTKSLYSRWGVGDNTCGNGVVVFLAVGERKLFISTGPGTKTVLPNDQVELVIQAMEPELKKKAYGAAVEVAVRNIAHVLAGEKLSRDATVVWVLLGVTISLVLLCVCSFTQDCIVKRRKRSFDECCRHLGNCALFLDKAQPRMRTCLLCLCELTPENQMTLHCGHSFCKKCMKRTGTTVFSTDKAKEYLCPVALQSGNRNRNSTVSEHTPFLSLPNATQHRCSNKRQVLCFYLQTLQELYPHFISQELCDEWCSKGDFAKVQFAEHPDFLSKRPSSTGLFDYCWGGTDDDIRKSEPI